jgi:hypothetical protein
MVLIRHIQEDYNHCSYITIVNGNNEKYFIRTVLDPNDSSKIRTILYKRFPNNPVAVQLREIIKQRNVFENEDMHVTMVRFVANELSLFEKRHFQE